MKRYNRTIWAIEMTSSAALYKLYRGLAQEGSIFVPMQEELTTEMHWEFMQCEVPREDFMLMAVVGAMNRGATKADALKEHGLSEEYFDENYERVMKS